MNNMLRTRERGLRGYNLDRSKSFSLLSSLPSEFTFARADASTVATVRGSDGKLVLVAANTPRFDHDISGNPLGLLREPTRQNKCTNYNINPTDLTGLTKTGDAAGVLSILDDSAALAAAGLDNICTNGMAIDMDNTAGTTNMIVTISGTAGNTNNHSFSAYARMVTGAFVTMQTTSSQGTISFSSTSYIRRVSNDVTIDNSARSVRFIIAAGRRARAVLNQFEEGSLSTSPIKVAGATATRAAETLFDSAFNTRPWFNSSAGAVVADFTMADITTNAQQHLVFVSKGIGLDDTMSTYQIAGTTRSKVAGRVYVGTSAQTIAENNGVDKASLSRVTEQYVESLYARYPSAVAWNNGALVTTFAGAGIFKSVIPSGTIDGITRLDIGGRGGSELFHGHILSVKIYNRARTTQQIGQDMVKTGEQVLVFSGQSLAYVHFSAQVGSTNGGEKSGMAIFDGIKTTSRNWLLNGSTSGTSVKYYSATSTDANYWINTETLEKGAPFRRWVALVQGARNGTIRAIVDVAGESDAGNCTVAEFKAAQLAKFQIMSETMGLTLGDIPIFISLIGRNTNADYVGYQTIREAGMEMAREYAYIHLLPEKFDIALEGTDGIHTSDAGNIILMPRWIRYILSTLGETVSGAVTGSSISAVSRSGDTVTVTLSHPSGITDFTPTTAIEGFAFLDNTTPITINTAVRTDATTITLTLASTPSNANQSLYYARNALSAVNTANLVKGNDANTLPMNAAKWVSSNAGTSFGT